MGYLRTALTTGEALQVQYQPVVAPTGQPVPRAARSRLSQGTDQVSQKRLIAPTIPVRCVRLTVPCRLASCPSVSRLRNTALAALLAGVASCDLILMGGEGGQDLSLLALRDLGEVQRPSEFRGHHIEFGGGDPQIPVRLLQAERRR